VIESRGQMKINGVSVEDDGVENIVQNAGLQVVEAVAAKYTAHEDSLELA